MAMRERGEMKALAFCLMLFIASTAFGQTSQRRRQTSDSKGIEANCISTMIDKVPGKVLNHYNNNGPDDLIQVFSNGKIDVYTDQTLINAYTSYPGPYSGEFAGPLYFAFRDETTRQAAITIIRDHRPANFLSAMTSSASGGRTLQDCAIIGAAGNLSYLQYIAADVVFTKHGPGNVLLPPGADMPLQLLIVSSALYLASPRCVCLGAFDKAIARSIPGEEEYIDALDQTNSSLIVGTYGGSNRDEFMSIFVDDPRKIDRTVLPGYYQINEANATFLFRSIMGAVAKINEGRQRNAVNHNPPDDTHDVSSQPANPYNVPTPARAKEVAKGQTIAQVQVILGPPERILDAGAVLGSYSNTAVPAAKSVYFYPNLKVVFVNGKVSEIQWQ
jgi:hypothetical protein